jgi:predicted hydrolase (HD superfamily)
MLPLKTLKEIEGIARKEKEGTDTLIHDFGHLERTAAGARWFVKVLGGPEEEQELAYAAGLLHDIVRPNTEKEDHAAASAKRSGEILEGLGVDKEDVRRILEAIADHRRPVEWRSPLHQSVFLADKILEQMGAFVVFRRSYYIGECHDFDCQGFGEAMTAHYRRKLEKFRPDVFPTRFRRLVDYQYEWVTGFFGHFSGSEPWAVELARMCYEAGKTHGMTMDGCVRAYKPREAEGRRLTEEALAYMEGRKFPEFEKFLQ